MTDEDIKKHMEKYLDRIRPENLGRPREQGYSDQGTLENPGIAWKRSVQSIQRPETLSPLGSDSAGSHCPESHPGPSQSGSRSWA